jgi:hypothetical protein
MRISAFVKRSVFGLLFIVGVAAMTGTVLQAKPDDKVKDDKPQDKKERVVSVPEPGTLMLLAVGIGGVVAQRARRRRPSAQL